LLTHDSQIKLALIELLLGYMGLSHLGLD